MVSGSPSKASPGGERPPLVAIAGRPNVGKSTLFNRLVGRRISIVEETPGVTRDLIFGEFEWMGQTIRLVDAGGIGGASEDPLRREVEELAWKAVSEADLVVLMVDGRAGLTDDDWQVANRLKRMGKRVILAINKVESERIALSASECYQLGFEKAVMISALSGLRIGELLDAISEELGLRPPEKRRGGRRLRWEEPLSEREAVEVVSREGEEERYQVVSEETIREEVVLAEEGGEEEIPAEELPYGMTEEDLRWLYQKTEEQARRQVELEAGGIPRRLRELAEEMRGEPIRVAFVGRQNVGKSSLTNMLLGEYRALVSDLPGTTRDAVLAELTFGDHKFELLDTAGMKKLSRLKSAVEYFSFVRARGALRYGEVAVLTLDASQGITEMDKRVAKRIAEEGKAVVVAVNKWDLMPEGEEFKESYLSYLDQELYRLTWAPKVFTSAVKGWGGEELMRAVMVAWENYHRVVDPRGLSLVVREALELTPPPVVKNRPLRVYRVSQVGIRPPTFEFEVNWPDAVHRSYQQYLENVLRRNFELEGTSIRLTFKARKTRKRRGRGKR